jgi:hypothetical protein
MAAKTNTTPSTEEAKAKNRKQYNVVFHVANDKSLDAIANAYGVNDPAIGKPLSVPQYLKELALRDIAVTEHKRGFDVAREEELETRTVGVLPAWATNLPLETQNELRSMSKKDRDAAGALMMAEAMRFMAAQNGSVLSEMAKHLASADGRAQREQAAAKVEASVTPTN